MKPKLLFLSLCCAFSAWAQTPEASFHPVSFEKTECISASQRAEVRQQIERNKLEIEKTRPNAFQHKGNHPLFIFPIQPKVGFSGYGYYSVNNYVDHNPTPNGNLLDFECGNRTYDWSNGNHEGTDYVLWPYPWKRMQEDLMEIVAAAPGTIVDKRDGNFDLNCLNNGNPNWNGIIVEHADGSQAWYWHFKDGGITSKNVGETVAAGEFLGIAGSSGSSVVPHLHFEIYDASGNLIDPYQGPCNTMNSDSWWAAQPDYFVPAINHLSTHSTQAFDDTCGVVENTYEELNFEPGDELVFRIFYRDLQTDAETHIIFRKPDGTIQYDWVFASPWQFYPQAYAQWNFEVDATWPDGVYNVEVEFGGNSYETIFGVNTNLGTADVIVNEVSIHPNPTSDKVNITSTSQMDKIRVYDVMGRIVLETFPNGLNIELDLSRLNSGMYLAIISSEGKQTVKKIIKE
ncbi:T9SS type A sorting domain-containing protein [Aequorivita echinoideorum]|uniref:T9SS type A sorting domain-containing protein n=1 Tax=Aequorivita echinoideorum TaxID=1549647 RepID=A0ABS5S3I9_9FLAO|nr:T9SS type A sorting domain-containing protein [Aequorivita echinoideorum]MBT0607777.1 T9SS type A sorting domain-containing protein [Aequorivita echinoideorum]